MLTALRFSATSLLLPNYLEIQMQVTSIKIKLFGKTAVMFRVIDSKGEVLQVLETEQEAHDWIASRA